MYSKITVILFMNVFKNVFKKIVNVFMNVFKKIVNVFKNVFKNVFNFEKFHSQKSVKIKFFKSNI